MAEELTQEKLKHYLHYSEETGLFTAIRAYGARLSVGDVAGSKNPKGYVRIKFFGKAYVAHHLVWLYVYGNLPRDQIDHINRIKHDNRLVNLREASNAQNQFNTRLKRNNLCGYRGVSRRRESYYQARATVDGKTVHLGVFSTAEQASQAYEKFAKEHHKEFYRGN